VRVGLVQADVDASDRLALGHGHGELRLRPPLVYLPREIVRRGEVACVGRANRFSE